MLYTFTLEEKQRCLKIGRPVSRDNVIKGVPTEACGFTFSAVRDNVCLHCMLCRLYFGSMDSGFITNDDAIRKVATFPVVLH